MLAFRMHQCRHRPCTIIHLQWHLAQSWCSEKGKHDREHLHSSRDLTSLLLSALPMPLLFAPDVYGIDTVSVHPLVQSGSSYPQACCFVSVRPFPSWIRASFFWDLSPHPITLMSASPQIAWPFLFLRPHCLLMEILTYLTQICNYC